MHTKLKLLVVLSSVLLTMCTFYDQNGAVISPNGLSCQSHTSIASVEGQAENNHFYMYRQAAECSYQCPDGKFKDFELSEKFSASSPLYSASKEELDAQFCGTTLQPTPQPASTQPLATVPPISTVFPTVVPTTSSTVAPTVSPTAPPTEQVASSPTAATSAAAQSPVLRGDVTMCDVAANLINFRMVEPVPVLTGKALEVQIAGQQSLCAINPVNTSLLTCTMPASVTFPTRIVVRLDGVVVNDFTYNGLGCAKLTTPFPTTTP